MSIIWLAPYYTYLLWFKSIWHGPLTKGVEKRERDDESGMTVDIIMNCGAEPKHALFFSGQSASAYFEKIGCFCLENDEEEAIKNSGEGEIVNKIIVKRAYDIFSSALGVHELINSWKVAMIVFTMLLVGGLMLCVGIDIFGFGVAGKWIAIQCFAMGIIVANILFSASVIVKMKNLLRRVDHRSIRVKRELRENLPSVIRLNEVKSLRSCLEGNINKKVVAL